MFASNLITPYKGDIILLFFVCVYVNSYNVLYIWGCRLISKRVHFDRFWRGVDKNLVGTNTFSFLRLISWLFYCIWKNIFPKIITDFCSIHVFFKYDFDYYADYSIQKRGLYIYLKFLLFRVKFMLIWKFPKKLSGSAIATFYWINFKRLYWFLDNNWRNVLSMFFKRTKK